MPRKLRTLTLDFETFYATPDYSLRNMPVALYIRDPRFKVFGAAIKFGDCRSQWVSGPNLQSVFDTIPWGQVRLVGHNLPFDGHILTEVYGHSPAEYSDTLGMARALIGGAIQSRGLHAVGEYLGLGGKLDDGAALHNLNGVRDPTPEQMRQLATYALRDADLTYDVWCSLFPEFPEGEREVLDWTVRMATEPLLELDEGMVQAYHTAELIRKEELVKRLGVTKTALRSNERFAALLRSAGVEPPTKVSPITGEETFAFSKADQAFVDLRESPVERVADLVEGRLAVKSSIEETRASIFLDLARTGKSMPVPLLYSGAMQTHRLSGAQRLNLQNLGRASPLRKAIVAPDKHVLVVSDSSNIELRIAMKLASERTRVEQLRAGEDLYSSFASELFGVPVSKALAKNDETVARYRQIGKIAMLSLQYQSGWKTFAQMTWQQTGGKVQLDEDEAKAVVYTYRAMHKGIGSLWGRMGRIISWMTASQGNGDDTGLLGAVPRVGGPSAGIDGPVEVMADRIILPSGLAVKYPSMRASLDDYARVEHTFLNYTKGGRSRIYPGLMTENLCQALARECVTHWAMQVEKRYPVVLQVHDELVAVVHESEKDEAVEFVTRIMSTPPPFWPDLPVACETAAAKRYGDAK